MSNDFNFGARLKALRLSLNLTQSGFARKIGVPQATISAYELSKISPSAEVIEKISKTFGVTIDWLFVAIII